MGVLVDRWSRRFIMVASSTIRAVVVAVLVAAPVALDNELLLLVAALTLLGLGRLFLTTKGAVLPLLAEGRELVAANSLSAGAGMVSALAGGTVGIAVAGAGGARSALAAGAFVYLAAAAASLRLQIPRRRRVHRPLAAAAASVARDLLEGLRGLLGRMRTALPIISIFFIRTITMFGVLASLLAIKQEFALRTERGGRLSLVAIALAAAGLGAFLGVVTGARVSSRFERHRLLLAGFGVVAASTFVLAAWRTGPALMAATFLGGYGAFLAKVAVDALLQEAVDDEFRGRAFALYDIAYNVASVVAGVCLVATASRHPGAVLAAAGLLTVVAGAALHGAFRRTGTSLPDD